MNKRSLWICATAALVLATALAGCGGTNYFAGRTLPPSGLTNRVMIAIQNPSALSKGALQFVDAFYDIRSGYSGTPASFSISGYSGALPISIQNMPEQQEGAVYGSGDGSLALINYAKESTTGGVSGLNGPSSSIFITRNLTYAFAANQATHVLTIVNQSTGSSTPLSLPGIYRVSVNPGGSMALAFVQNSNYVYYPLQLTAAQTITYSGGPTTWPLGAVDCEPQNAPLWCLLQALDPSSTKASPVPLTFNRPVKAVFSADGNTAYVLNCGPECGGTTAPVAGFPATASVSPLPVGAMIFLLGQQSGILPSQTTLTSSTLAIPGGASNALVNTSTLYVVGQCLAAESLSNQQPQCASGSQTQSGLFTGMLTVVNLPTGSTTAMTAGNAMPISDGAPGAVSRMLLADDDTLWIGMTKCTNGTRATLGLPDGCLTMFNTSTNTVTTLEPYNGDATGIAAVTDYHKIYTAEGGQVYIYSTVDGSAIDNQYVTVTGTAYDVAYMDGLTDANNTVY